MRRPTSVDAAAYWGSPVGIGPVISGYENGAPVYYVDVAYRSGRVTRMSWPRAGRAFDRATKNEAYRQRIILANQHRPGVVLTHDQDSFLGLVSLLSSQPARSARAAA